MRQNDNDEVAFAIFKAICRHLNVAIFSSHMFNHDHPKVITEIDQVLSKLSKLRTDLTVVLFDNVLIVNNIKLKQKEPATQKFADLLRKNRIEGISFSPGVTKKELALFIKTIASAKNSIQWEGSAIVLGKLVPMDAAAGTVGFEAEQAGPRRDQPQKVFHLPSEVGPEHSATQILSDIDHIQEGIRDLPDGKKKSEINELARAIHYFTRGFSESKNPMGYLGSIKAYDEYTFVHVSNVFILTMCLAEALGFQGKMLYDIGIAAAFHDIGKLFISRDIINKKGFLTDEEKDVMQTHSIKGARFLLEIEGMTNLAVLSAMEHHIRYDGSGYPYIKKNWRPNIVSQMITLADAFDAMRSHRPYQQSKSQDLVIKILKKECGTAFNPLLVNTFVMLLQNGGVTQDG